jgi:hypothetical protein
LPYIVSRMTGYLHAAAPHPSTSAPKSAQVKAESKSMLALRIHKSSLQQGWNVKSPVEQWGRRMAFTNHTCALHDETPSEQ